MPTAAKGSGSHLPVRSVLLPSAEVSTGDPHPLDPASLLKKAWRKLYAMLYQTSVLCILTFLLIYSIVLKFQPLR